MKHSRIGHWEWDFKTGAVVWSAGLFRLFGVVPDSVKPSLELFLNFVLPEDRPLTGVQNHIGSTLLDEAIDCEFRILRQDGQIRWLSSQAEVFRDAQGEPSWAAGIAIDVTAKYDAERRLGEREEKYRALVQATSVAEWSADPQGNITEASFWSEYTGQSHEDVRSGQWLRAVHPDDLASVTAVWAETLRLESVARLSFRVRRADGEYRWVHAAGVPLKDDNGTVREWVGQISDIHDQRENEHRLRASETRLRLAARIARAAIWEWDPQSDLLTRYDRATDGSSEVLPMQAALQRVDPRDRAALESALRALSRERQFDEHEFRFINRDGHLTWQKLRAGLVGEPASGQERYMGVVFNITPRKQAESEARLLREQLDLAFGYREAMGRLIPGFAWSTNALGQLIVDSSCLWLRMTGQTEVEATGRGWLDAVHPEDQERTRNHWRGAVETGASFDVVHRVRRPDGSYTHCHSRALPIYDDNGLVREWVGISSERSSPQDSRQSDVARSDVRQQEQASVLSGGLVGWQVRAARGILNLSVRELSDLSGLSVSSIKRVEETDEKPHATQALLNKLQASLENAGVVFQANGGVRRRDPSQTPQTA